MSSFNSNREIRFCDSPPFILSLCCHHAAHGYRWACRRGLHVSVVTSSLLFESTSTHSREGSNVRGDISTEDFGFLSKHISSPILPILPLTASVRTRLPSVPLNSQKPPTGLATAATTPPPEGQTDMKMGSEAFHTRSISRIIQPIIKAAVFCCPVLPWRDVLSCSDWWYCPLAAVHTAALFLSLFLTNHCRNHA